MKNYIFFIALIILASCAGENPKSEADEKVSFLTKGKWKIVEFDGEVKSLSQEMVFSKDKQFFNIDSQGRIIPRNMKKVFDVKSDTLLIVDYNYEPQFIENKGTFLFRIIKIDDSKMELESIYPDSTSTYKLKNEEL